MDYTSNFGTKRLIAFIFLAFTTFFCFGQAIITIEVNWPNWSSENRVTFRDPSNAQIGASICNPAACFNGSGNNSYYNIGSPATYTGIAYGSGYSLLLQDTYGDGWNGVGSYVRVYQDGILILNTDLTGGISSTVSFNILAPSPTLSINDVSVNENTGVATFTVTHVGNPTIGPFTATYTTVNGTALAGSDYTSSTGTLNFNGTAGDTEQITIIIIDETVLEPDEDFLVQFTGASDGTVNISDTATGTILNDDNDPNSTRPYQERYSMNLKGDFLMRGNTNLRCVSNCPSSPTSNNPSVVMGYIDVDSDGTTVNSSSSNFSIPAGATVQWAGLYWGGMYNSSNSGITNPPGTLNIDQVKFKTPSAGTYATIDAEIRNIETTQFSGWRTFMSFAEVTDLVQSGGNGNYFVADIALTTGSSFTGPHGGWTMVIVYNDPTDSTRNVSIWDGFDFFGFGANDTFTVTDLLTPATGAFETHAGYYGMDGEASHTGDYVSINGTALSNGLNPNNNTLNGTITEYGTDVGGRNPNFGYSWGVDIDMFDATGSVPNGATSLNVQLGSSNEGIWGGVFAVSNEIAFPAVSSKSFSPSTIVQGDESTVTIIVDNPSRGVDLTNFSMTDTFPAGMLMSATPNASSSCGGILSAIPGSDSFTISGINVPAGSSCTFTFDVETLNIGSYLNTVYPTDTANDQGIPFEGESSGTLIVKVGSVITNRRITYRVNKN
ncbi:Calx-beta domain-containing protein [Maribacter algicola]|uniref:Calx-beta domain-containing protein n=1 Tax=Meishania litoralis TaxID=3434685 RepID=A0ACC7LMT0_9FLAO